MEVNTELQPEWALPQKVAGPGPRRGGGASWACGAGSGAHPYRWGRQWRLGADIGGYLPFRYQHQVITVA